LHPSRRQLRERHGARVRASFTLVAPLAGQYTATDTREPDTRQLGLFEPAPSGAVVPLIDRPHAGLRRADVEGANDPQHAGNSDYAWIQNFGNGNQNNANKDNRYLARFVRSVDRDGISFSELLAADIDCRRHKRNTASAKAWEADREANLVDLHARLNDGTYTPGPSICFVITRPKNREVWAAGYPDRIVHHAVYRHIGPRFERAFIADSCACIKGRGTLYAARRLERKVRAITASWTRRAYYLKCDLSNFFPSIRKDLLAELLAPRIPEPFWRDLALRILFHDPRPGVDLRGDPRRLALVPPEKSLFGRPANVGLPIGNLSSQFGANVFLDVLDQFVKHRLRARHYVRYVDDFILLHESPAQLNAWLAEITAFLPARLGVHINPRKTVLQPLERGVDFVGHVLKPHRRTIRRRTVNEALFRVATMTEENVHESTCSYFGLFRQATHSQRDRARLANVARRRGFAVDHALTKAYA